MNYSSITHEGFSFHTFEMTKSITYEEYQMLKNGIFSSASKEKYRAFQDGNCLISEKYKTSGVIIYLFNNTGKPPHLQLRINPRTICEGARSIGIFQRTKENIALVQAEINQILTAMGTGYDFNSMTVSRIDLCVNLEMDQSYLDAYMRVIRKCKLPESYRRVGFLKDEPDSKIKNKHSFRAANKDVQLTIYDKNFQVAQGNLQYPDTPIINGLIRFEVSLKRDAIYRNNEYFRLQLTPISYGHMACSVEEL